MMTRAQIIDLLSVITAYDNRNASEATILAWGTVAEIGRWTFPEAVAAVHAHFASSSEWLMPAHITEAIRARRNQPPPPEIPAQRTIDAAPPADPAHIGRVIAQLSEQMGWTREIDHRAVMAVACSHCGAQPWQECTRPSRASGRVSCRPHPTRVDTAKAAAQ